MTERNVTGRHPHSRVCPTGEVRVSPKIVFLGSRIVTTLSPGLRDATLDRSIRRVYHCNHSAATDLRESREGLVDMGSQENADLIRSGYEAFSRGDVATVVGLFSPDIAWHVPGQGPIAGDYHGPDEVLGFFGVLASETGGSFELSVHDLLASDDHVVALCTQKAERNGKTFTGNLVHVWHVSDGKATEFWGIPEDAAAADEFWAPA